MRRSTIILTACLAISVTPALAEPSSTRQAGEAPVQLPPEDRPPPRGSLLRKSLNARSEPGAARVAAVSYYSVSPPEPRTMKKHDLVTVIIREESSFSSNGSTETSKEMGLDASLDEWVKLNLRNLTLNGGGEGSNPPSIKLGGKRDFSGEGKVDRKDAFIARIQAEVIDVKPNGTFAIQARKRIKTDDEEQEFILTGICRGADVTIDNTVLSTQVYNLELEKKHKGAIKDSTKRGWVPKLLDFVNPF